MSTETRENSRFFDSSPTLEKLFSDLVKAQLKPPTISRTGRNPAFNSKYAKLEDSLPAVLPWLAEHNLCLSQLPFSDGDRIGVTTILGHISGQYLAVSASLIPRKEKDPQICGSHYTYFRRYQALSICGLADEEDNDGNDETIYVGNENQRQQLMDLFEKHKITDVDYMRQISDSAKENKIKMTDLEKFMKGGI